MSEIARRLNQCKKPSGDLGKAVADSMNENHYELTGWGLDKIKIEEDDIILDIGCGGGRTINRLASMTKSGKVIGIDYSIDCVNWSKDFNKELIDEGKVEVYNASVEKLPFENEKFNVVTAIETIYFWPNLVENFKEIKRVLKSGGTFIIINEIYANDRFKKRNEEYKNNSNMKIHTPEELKQLFVDSGYTDINFDVVEDKNWICCRGKA